ncbi:MAG: hypothetical protein H8E98_04550 [Bacteroidetes bacterium]|nr:hypothetical protein [Bacteroidota bacterium]
MRIPKIKNWFNPKYSPYCKLCSSCGEEGCCSPISCMYKCMDDNQPKKCEYGAGYAKDLHFAYLVEKSQSKLIHKLKKRQINQREFFEELDKEWHHFYDFIYKGVELPEELKRR